MADDWITPQAAPSGHDDWITPGGSTDSAPPPDNGGILKNIGAGFEEGLTGLVALPSEVASTMFPGPAWAAKHIINTGARMMGAKKDTLPEGTTIGQTATHALNSGLGLIGLNPEDVTANTTGERIARMGGMGATALLAPEMEAPEIADAMAPLATRVASRFSNSPIASTVRKGVTGTVAGAAGGVGQEAVPDEYPGLKQAVGVLASIAGGAAAESPGMVRGAARGVQQWAKPLTTGGPEDVAGDILRGTATDPGAVAANLDQAHPEIVTGSKPTTFQQTGDMGLGALERSVAAKNPAPFMQRRADQNSARTAALAQLQEGGDPDAVGTFLRGQFRNFDDQTQQHIDALTAQAQAQTEALGGSGAPEEHGAALRDTLQQAENTARARERSLWQAVDPDRNLVMPTQPTVQAAQDIAGSLSPSAKPMSGEEAAIFDVAANYQPQMPFADLSDLRSRTSAAMREELVTKGATPTYARLSRLRGAIQNNLAEAATNQAGQDAVNVANGAIAPEETLANRIQSWASGFLDKKASQDQTADGWAQNFYGNKDAQARAGLEVGLGQTPGSGTAADVGGHGAGFSPPGGFGNAPGDQSLPPVAFDQAAADRLAEATQATKDRVQAFGAGPAKQALAKAGTQDAYRLPEARVPEKFFHAGPTSFADIQKLRSTVGDESALPILQDYAASSLRKAAERADGTLDPKKVTAWQAKYGNALRAFPDLSDSFSTAASASDAIAESAAARREAIADRNSSALGKVAGAQNADDVTRTIGNIFGKNNATQAMSDLVQAASRSPEALQGLRQAVADHITSKLISNTEAGTSGQGLFKSDQFQTFVKRNRGALSQVFSPEEMGTFDAIAADLNRANRSITAVKLPGGSNSVQDLYGAIAHSPHATVLDRTLAEAGTEAGGALAAHATGGLSWLGAKVTNAFRGAGLKRVDDLLTEAMLNPELARDLLRRAPSQPDSGQSVALASRLRRVGLATAATRLGSDNRAGYARGGRTAINDAGKTIPESAETLKAQQDQLVAGRRPAMLFPKQKHGNAELPLPKGMARTETKDGVFHFHPKHLTAAKIAVLSKRGRLNEILGLGPHSKADIHKRAKSGESLLAVTERSPSGTEVRAAAGTDRTAPSQIQHFERTKTPGHSVWTERPDTVIRGRTSFADGGRTTDDSEGSGLSAGQIFARNQPWLKKGASGFNTALSPSDESQFQSWVQKNGVNFDPAETTPDYDMRGFWQAKNAGDPRATTAINSNDQQTHYPDFWKTPYDATFSAQSQWANQDAPDWNGDRLVAPNGTVVWDDSTGGTPAPPVAPTPRPDPDSYKRGGRVHAAAAQADTDPSDAQIEAGNYRKGHVTLHGFDFTIETPKGAARRGIGADGTHWENRHPTAHYGYIKRTEGADGEHVDTYIGPHHDSERVFVVNQFDPKTKAFDEHKLVFGARTGKEARAIYDGGFSDGSGPKRRWAVHEMNPALLKAWLASGKTKRPFPAKMAA